MTHRCLSLAACLMSFVVFGATGAKAEKFDVKTLQCGQLLEIIEKGSKDDKYGAGAILYWVAGYSGPTEQSTVIDFDGLGKDFTKITDQCREQPKVGVLTTAEKFMGDGKGTPTGKDAIDIATMTCEAVLKSDKKDEEGLGLILMWMAGYHAYNHDDTVFDSEQFGKDAEEIGKYCAENPETSFFKASEEIMGAEDDGKTNE